MLVEYDITRLPSTSLVIIVRKAPRKTDTLLLSFVRWPTDLRKYTPKECQRHSHLMAQIAFNSGPNREFRMPPQCVIAPLSSDPMTSIYRFKIDPPQVRAANARGMRYIELTQTCSRWRETGNAGNDALNDMVTQGQLASLAAREDVKLRTCIPLHLHDRVFEVSQ